MTAAGPAYRLKSGHEMPVLGLGTWELTGRQCTEVVHRALEMGYTHIDTAEVYENESEIAPALKDYDRQSLFITSKVAPKHFAKSEVLKACQRSLRKLETEYLDLYLLHWPNNRIPLDETLEAMQQLIEKGLIRSAGLSNYDVPRIEEALSISDIPVCNLQIEYHPLTQRSELPEFCRQEDIAITAYSPLARGEAVSNKTIQCIAENIGRTPAQVSLRWLIQKGHIVIPKASTEAHLRDIMDIFDWGLEDDDMQQIDHIQHSQRLVDTKYT